MKTQFVVRTKKPAQYFRGEITQGYFPIEGKSLYFINCLSYAGGNRIDAPIKLINFNDQNRKALIQKIKNFAKSGKYIFSINPKDF